MTQDWWGAEAAEAHPASRRRDPALEGAIAGAKTVGEAVSGGWIADLLAGGFVLVATLALSLLGAVLVIAGVLGVLGVGPGDVVRGPAGVAMRVGGA